MNILYKINSIESNLPVYVTFPKKKKKVYVTDNKRDRTLEDSTDTEK